MAEADAGLQRVDDGISTELREQVRTMVDAKYLVDELARDRAGRRLLGPFYDSRGPRNGAEVFRGVFPFADIDHDGEAFSGLVPTTQTIGASERWTTQALSEEERQTSLVFLRAPERASPAATERAEYFWIRQLGLFLAHEGKNRVGFFRDMQVDWIPAWIIPCRYIAADRLSTRPRRRQRNPAGPNFNWPGSARSQQPDAHSNKRVRKDGIQPRAPRTIRSTLRRTSDRRIAWRRSPARR